MLHFSAAAQLNNASFSVLPALIRHTFGAGAGFGTGVILGTVGAVRSGFPGGEAGAGAAVLAVPRVSLKGLRGVAAGGGVVFTPEEDPVDLLSSGRGSGEDVAGGLAENAGVRYATETCLLGQSISATQPLCSSNFSST
ncbi:hypothetical protein D3C86_1773400 [compost metagenome]